MAFGDEPKALHLLQNISYYRLSGYWYPLLADKQQHIFKLCNTFETAYINSSLSFLIAITKR